MKYFLDTEFLDDATTRTVELISLALVCEDGRELYLVNGEFDRGRADDWLNVNVMPQLPPCECPGGARLDHLGHTAPCKWMSRVQMRDAVIAFIHDDGTRAEFWAYFASYDWLCFVQLFGKMIDLPKHFQWLVNDIRTWATTLGYKGKFKELLPDTGHHDALADARWNRDAHKILVELFARDRVERAAMNIDKLVEAAVNYYKEIGLDPGIVSAIAKPNNVLWGRWLSILTEEDL